MMTGIPWPANGIMPSAPDLKPSTTTLPRITICVMPCGPHMYIEDMLTSQTIWDLKNTLHYYALQIPVEQQKIILWGKELGNDTKLGSINLEDMQRLYVERKGGAPRIPIKPDKYEINVTD